MVGGLKVVGVGGKRDTFCCKSILLNFFPSGLEKMEDCVLSCTQLLCGIDLPIKGMHHIRVDGNYMGTSKENKGTGWNSPAHG